MGIKANAIREHNLIHSTREKRAIKITEYLDEAANLMELYEAGRLIDAETLCSEIEEMRSIVACFGDDYSRGKSMAYACAEEKIINAPRCLEQFFTSDPSTSSASPSSGGSAALAHSATGG